MTHSLSGFRGVVPPVVTPLHLDGSVDFASYTRVLEHLLAGGVHGVFALGSTSECVFHERETRRAILEHTIRVVAGRVPVLAGVMAPATATSRPVLSPRSSTYATRATLSSAGSVLGIATSVTAPASAKAKMGSLDSLDGVRCGAAAGGGRTGGGAQCKERVSAVELQGN
jgi:hypothetical protein